ncbi:PLC-like phosphodiesterase [Aspergillus varians]
MGFREKYTDRASRTLKKIQSRFKAPNQFSTLPTAPNTSPPPPYNSAYATGDPEGSFLPSPGPSQSNDPHNTNEPEFPRDLGDDRPTPTGSSTAVTEEGPSSETLLDGRSGTSNGNGNTISTGGNAASGAQGSEQVVTSAEASNSSENQQDQVRGHLPDRDRHVRFNGGADREPVSYQDDASPLAIPHKMDYPPPRKVTHNPRPVPESSHSGGNLGRDELSQGGESSYSDSFSGKGNSAERGGSRWKGKAPDRGPLGNDKSSEESNSLREGKASHHEDSSRRDEPPGGGASSSSAPASGEPPRDDKQQDGGRQGGESRQGDSDKSQNSSQQSVDGLSVTCFAGTICNQAHRLPSLQNTPRAHVGLSYLCGGVTAHIQVSRDKVPFVYRDSNLMRYQNQQDPESLTWSELMSLHDKSTQDFDVRIMSLNDLLDSVSLGHTQHRLLYLEIKSRRDAAFIATSIEKILQSSRYALTWRFRIVFCISSQRHLPAFGVIFAGYKIVLQCDGLEMAREIMNKHNLVHFKLNRTTLISNAGLAFVAEARRNGRDVYVEIVNRANEMKWCIRAQVTGIITDYPAELDSLYWEAECYTPSWMNPKGAFFASTSKKFKAILPDSLTTAKSATQGKAGGNGEASSSYPSPLN